MQPQKIFKVIRASEETHALLLKYQGALMKTSGRRISLDNILEMLLTSHPDFKEKVLEDVA